MRVNVRIAHSVALPVALPVALNAHTYAFKQPLRIAHILWYKDSDEVTHSVALPIALDEIAHKLPFSETLRFALTVSFRGYRESDEVTHPVALDAHTVAFTRDTLRITHAASFRG